MADRSRKRRDHIKKQRQTGNAARLSVTYFICKDVPPRPSQTVPPISDHMFKYISILQTFLMNLPKAPTTQIQIQASLTSNTHEWLYSLDFHIWRETYFGEICILCMFWMVYSVPCVVIPSAIVLLRNPSNIQTHHYQILQVRSDNLNVSNLENSL